MSKSKIPIKPPTYKSLEVCAVCGEKTWHAATLGRCHAEKRKRGLDVRMPSWAPPKQEAA